jgi:hypothetical protein
MSQFTGQPGVVAVGGEGADPEGGGEDPAAAGDEVRA